MSEGYPNGKQLTNTSFSRLVRDSCGHLKCRICLLCEEDGCKNCQIVHCIQSNQNYLQEPCSTIGDSNEVYKSLNEEITLPLQLIINKDHQSNRNDANSIFVEYTSPILHNENVTPDNNKNIHEYATNNVVTNNDFLTNWIFQK